MSKLTINKMTIKNNFHVIISIIIIWLVGLIYIKDGSAIKILGDEFGYWTVAAWLTGKDWMEVATLNSYYGYGYGAILSLILTLPLDPITRYKIAILLNILMLCAVYCIINYLVNEFHVFEKKYLSSCIALCATLYTGNTYCAQFTMTETIILLGFWVSILLLYSLHKNYKLYKVFLFSFILIYLYTVHQRTLGIICAGILCLIYIQLKKKRYTDVFLFLLIILTLSVGAEFLKNFYQNTYLSKGDNQLLKYNDYSGQTSKIAFLLSWEGICSFIISAIGKIFYILSSTYLLAGIAFFSLGEKIYSFMKQKKVSSSGLLAFFILLTTVFSIAIASIYLIKYQTRFDLLIYGRYNEFFICSLILIGLISLIKADKINWFKVVSVMVIYFIIMIIVTMKIPSHITIDCSFHSAPGIYDTLSLYDRNITMVGLKAYILFALILLFVYLLKKKKKDIFIIYVCALTALSWTISYISDYKIGFLPWYPTYDQQETVLADYIEQMNIHDNLYFYAEEGNNIDHLQYFIADIPIKCVYTKDQLYDLPADAYLLTEYHSFLLDLENQQDFTQLMQSHRIRLWKVNK